MASIKYSSFWKLYNQKYEKVRLFQSGLLLAAGADVVYLVKIIACAFNWLSDLGIREDTALWAFAPFSVFAPLPLTASLTLWLVNILMLVLY